MHWIANSQGGFVHPERARDTAWGTKKQVEREKEPVKFVYQGKGTLRTIRYLKRPGQI
jgi:hypothetical protein